jgi:hypothetical protein
MKCNRVIERDPEGEVHTGCPNEAEVEKLIAVNNIPMLVPLCLFHDAEFDREAAAARARRNANNDKMRRQHGERAMARRRG